MKLQRLFLVIVLLTLGAAVVAFLQRPKLGLDIQGGARVVLEADTAKLPAGQKWDETTRNAVVRILDRRVNASGVAEPVITPKGDRQFVVEIPAVQNQQQILEQLQSTAQLQFYYSPEWVTNRNPIGRYEFQTERGSTGAREEVRILDRTARTEFGDEYHIGQELKQLIEKGAAATAATQTVALPDPLKTLPVAAGKESVPLTAEDAKRVPQLNEQLQNFRAFLSNARLELTGSDLKPTAQGTFNTSGNGQAVVNVEFNNAGREKFGNFTRDHTNEILMIYLDGRILSYPNIEVYIPGGQATISGFSSVKEAKELADYLNAGALPVPLVLQQQQTIEPTLGVGAVRAGVLAGGVGILLVMAFMVWQYLLPGFIAVIALILYTLFTYAIFLLIPVTFTLPGIAGFILSVGMAVDANILIFERTKEELQAGRPLRQSIESGFKRAFSAIFDSNLCTAVTSLLLFNFGNGPVKGFALTLLIGVAISMFTAITVTRTLLLLIMGAGGKGLSAWGKVRHFRLNAIPRRNLFYAFSVVTIIAGIALAFTGGWKPGIEFTGGSEMVVRLNESHTRAEVEQAVASAGIADPIATMAENGRLAFVRLPQQQQAAGKGVSRGVADQAIAALQGKFPGATEQSFETIGASISGELAQNAFNAIVLSSIFIVLYLAFRFSIGGLANGLKFGLCAIIAMLHDVAVLIGFVAIMGLINNWKVDSLFVTALLTVIGFSVHDTIVIFDRIRENLRNRARGEDFTHLVDRSINETFARSVNTSMTVVLTLVALLIFGGPVIKPLNAMLLVGIISGTYSSIFNAAALVVDWERWFGKGELSSVGAGGTGTGASGGGASSAAAPRSPAARPTAPVGRSTTDVPPSAVNRVNGEAGDSEDNGIGRTRPDGPRGNRRGRRM